jgi:hypothetical protein
MARVPAGENIPPNQGAPISRKGAYLFPPGNPLSPFFQQPSIPWIQGFYSAARDGKFRGSTNYRFSGEFIVRNLWWIIETYRQHLLTNKIHSSTIRIHGHER